MLASELCDKNVYDVTTGEKLGKIDDLELDERTGAIKKLVIYGRGKLLGLAGREKDVEIELKEVKVIGNDAVFVESAHRQGI